jgi:hypothetical protein
MISALDAGGPIKIWDCRQTLRFSCKFWRQLLINGPSPTASAPWDELSSLNTADHLRPSSHSKIAIPRQQVAVFGRFCRKLAILTVLRRQGQTITSRPWDKSC